MAAMAATTATTPQGHPHGSGSIMMPLLTEYTENSHPQDVQQVATMTAHGNLASVHGPGANVQGCLNYITHHLTMNPSSTPVIFPIDQVNRMSADDIEILASQH